MRTVAGKSQTGESDSTEEEEGDSTEDETPEETPPEEAPKEKWTAEQRMEITRRRSLLLAEWATAATQIGEGSNAISSAFYDRVEGFVSSVNSAYGSLGGASAIADTDRFVLFELTRGAALSAIQLGLQGAMNLKELDDVKAPAQTENVVYGDVQLKTNGVVQTIAGRSQ